MSHAPSPLTHALIELSDYVQESLGKVITGRIIRHDELALTTTKENVLKVLRFLRDDQECLFASLVDVTASDFPHRPQRFEMVYNLLSYRQNMRIRLKVPLADGESIESVTGLFSGANWMEREVWDMYGVPFENHPDQRRILTDYGFEGHPLRKEFPLTGFTEVRYDEELQRVVYEPVELVQEYREFDNISPWEGMTTMQLPGDEKAVKPKHGYREEGRNG